MLSALCSQIARWKLSRKFYFSANCCKRREHNQSRGYIVVKVVADVTGVVAVVEVVIFVKVVVDVIRVVEVVGVVFFEGVVVNVGKSCWCQDIWSVVLAVVRAILVVV